MLRELKFVQGAVAKKDFIPAMTHFCIADGRISAFNGRMALSSPIQCDLTCKPKALPMVQAIGRCGEAIQLAMTPAGRLSIKSGSFKAFVECFEEAMPDMQPEGDHIQVDGAKLLEAFKTCEPFIGNDASRVWTNGLLLHKQSAYATNNVCLIEYWIGTDFPHVVNIPREAINEAIRINEAPTHLQLANNSITFHYGDGRWIRTQLYSTEWPDLDRILEADYGEVATIDPSIFEGLELVKPFRDKMGRIIIDGDTLRTHEDQTDGASFQFQGDAIWPKCSYNLEMFMLLKDIGKQMDINAYPNPSLFFGDRLRGAIIGLRL